MNVLMRMLLSLFIIVAVGAGGFAASRALLSDQATLAANTFSTGTPDLLVCSGKTCTDYQDSDTGFTATILPGETKDEFFRLKNNSNDVDFSIAAQSSNLSGGINSDDVMITLTPVDGSYDQIVGSTPITHTLTEWQSPTNLGIPNVESGKFQRYRMDISLSSSVTTGGVQSIFDLVFTGTQVTPTPTP